METKQIIEKLKEADWVITVGELKKMLLSYSDNTLVLWPTN